MKPLTLGAWIVCGLLTTAPLAAQQKLGDVAGSIKLKKTGDETVVIDGSTAGQTSRRSASTSGSDRLYDVVNDCLGAAQALETIVGDAPRISPVSYSDEWRSQLDDVGQRLEALGLELQVQPDAGPYEAAYQKSVEGMDEVQRGFDAAIAAVESRRLIALADRKQVSSGVVTLGDAMTEMRSIGRSQAVAAPPPPIDPIAASASIRKVCSRSGAEGSRAYQECVSQQEASMNALVGRTAPAVGLDANSFNKIRNGCLYEWPENYFNRDACEIRRAAAASGR